MNHGLINAIVQLLSKEIEKPRDGKPGLVKMSPAMLIVGIVCTALFLIPGLILPLATGNWETWPFLIFAAMGASLIIAYINCRIWYNEDGFTARFFLGYRKTFCYAEIESLNKSPQNEKLKVRGCTVRVGELPIGKREFLAFARKQYRIAHGGKAIPAAPKPKWDIFNGHVENPGEFLAVYIILCLFMPVLTAVLWFVVEPTPMEELTMVTGQVEILGVEDNDLLVRCGGAEMEIWGYKRSLSDKESFLSACETGAEQTIGYRPVYNDDKELIGYSAEYIQSSEETLWLTPQRAKEYRFRSTAGVFALVELVLLAYCGMSVYVGRNPRKFSKKFIRQFFKDGYVH